MPRQNIIRALLFVVFFSIGAATLGGSMLCDDLLRYYHNKQILDDQEKISRQLESLNADYDALLKQIEEDPNFARRVAPATLGVEPNDADTVYPKATTRQLAAARKALMDNFGKEQDKPAMPRWLTRCSQPHRRIGLFLCGAGLILISFICFCPARISSQEQQ